jgi:hypothetical protein
MNLTQNKERIRGVWRVPLSTDFNQLFWPEEFMREQNGEAAILQHLCDTFSILGSRGEDDYFTVVV